MTAAERRRYNGGESMRFRGRRTNSPPQFGQTAFISSAHSRQKVHSYVQM
jgi:hypothetical protein